MMNPRVLVLVTTLSPLVVAAACGSGGPSGVSGVGAGVGMSVGSTAGVGASSSAAISSATSATVSSTTVAAATVAAATVAATSTSAAGVGATSSGSAPIPGSSERCIASALLGQLGTQHVLVGAAMQDTTAKLSAFDGRYQYISGALPDGDRGACASCASRCSVNGTTCGNYTPGCNWWGCWQDVTQAPGQFVTRFDAAARASAQIPMLSLYQVLQASGVREGTAECTAMNDAAFLTRYLAGWRFLLQQVGTAKVLLHVEPDLWAYCEKANANPHAEPAAVQAANPTDCASQENSIAGLGRCMIAMARKYAPNAKIGLHASAWGTNKDVLLNAKPSFDVAGHAAQLGRFLLAAGAGDGDFVVADMSDRDAGWYQSQGKDTWWDDTNRTLPNFHQAFAWAKTVAETVGKPIVWWQVPVGNMDMPNAGTQWRDNRVDYVLAHMDEVAAAHGAAVFFGAGNGTQTTPENDGGNLVAKVKAYAAAGGQKACP